LPVTNEFFSYFDTEHVDKTDQTIYDMIYIRLKRSGLVDIYKLGRNIK